MTTFSYRATKDDSVFISWNGRAVTSLRGDRARQFLAQIERGNEQLVMARFTGNFKRGNERVARSSGATDAAEPRWTPHAGSVGAGPEGTV